LRTPELDLWDALVLGVRDYVGKNGFPVRSLDSPAVLTLHWCWRWRSMRWARDKVRTLMMPSPYTADISWIDAREMAARLKVRYDEISIVPELEAFKASLAGQFKDWLKIRRRRISRPASAARC